MIFDFFSYLFIIAFGLVAVGYASRDRVFIIGGGIFLMILGLALIDCDAGLSVAVGEVALNATVTETIYREQHTGLTDAISLGTVVIGLYLVLAGAGTHWKKQRATM